MKLDYQREKSPDGSDVVTFSGSIDMMDLARLDLDHIDRIVMGQDVKSGADFLQSAEIIFRRYAEQLATKLPNI